MFKQIYKQLLKILKDNRGCFGGGAPKLDTTPPPKPDPAPSPTPTKVESAINLQAKRNKLKQVKRGILSTIKTSPQGVDDENEKLGS